MIIKKPFDFATVGWLVECCIPNFRTALVAGAVFEVIHLVMFRLEPVTAWHIPVYSIIAGIFSGKYLKPVNASAFAGFNPLTVKLSMVLIYGLGVAIGMAFIGFIRYD